jgi:hypothetical protein
MIHPIVIEKHNEIYVLRDDLLLGGTKSILMNNIDKPNINEFVYASPVYGGFQIALSAYCNSVGKKATIFCAKRKTKHYNTQKCIEHNANIIEVPFGYLSVVEKKAREYCYNKNNVEKIIFGANCDENKKIICDRVKSVINHLNFIPDEIWCAIGSGTLISSILMAVNESVKIFGVQVGAEFIPDKKYPNLTIIKYPKPFDKESKISIKFPSTPNYDKKAFELCLQYNKNINNKKILFWNVL